MTEEYFLPKIANQAINQEYIDQFFKVYRDLQERWPWEASADDWLDYILSWVEKPEMMSVFLEPATKGRGKLYFRVDGLVRLGVIFTAEQYERLFNAIEDRVIFFQSLTDRILKEGFIITQTEQKHWVGFLPTISGTQITLCFDRNLPSTNPFDGWSARAKTDVAKMQQHPNGLIICCHRNWSLSRRDTIYRVLDSLIARSNSEIRIGWITESLQNIPVNNNITQIICVDGSQKSWSQASSALIAHDVDLIVMRGSNQKEVVTQAITTSLEDRCVLVDVSHFSAIETIIWLFNDLPISPSLIASILVGVVGSYSGLRRVCPHCLSEHEADDSLLKLLKKQGIRLDNENKWVRGKGCSECLGTGYLLKPRLPVVETAYIDRSFANFCLSKPNAEQLRLALVEQGFKTYLQQAVEFARQGMTTLEEAVRVGLARRCEL